VAAAAQCAQPCQKKHSAPPISGCTLTCKPACPFIQLRLHQWQQLRRSAPASSAVVVQA
jgi:hypothetical protein